MPFVIPGTATGTESLVLDGLNLSQGPSGVIQLMAFTPPIFAKRKEWIEAADSDGAVLAREPLRSVGDATVTVAIAGVSRDDANTAVASLSAKLEEAEQNSDGIPLVWTPSDSTISATTYVLSGEVTERPVDWESGYMANQPTVTFTLSCAPGWYTTPVTYTGSATAGPLVTLDLADVPGDVPSDDATLTVTDSSSQSRRTVEWGAEWRYYNSASPWSLILDSDSLVTTGFAGTGTTRTGAYDPGASGNNVIRATVLGNATAVCGTGAQPHIGTFRVKARVYTGSSQIWTRLSWQAGDGSYTANDWTQPPVLSAFSRIDLGLITIPTANAGTQSWTGRIEVYSEDGSAQAVDVDFIQLVPVGSGYGKATASYAYKSGALVAYDTFTVADGTALNTRTPDAGAAWATSGAATDFTALSNQMKRSTNDAGSWRYAVFGSSMTDQEVSVDVSLTSANSSAALARWTDANNHLRLEASRVTGIINTYPLTLTKVVAGTPTVLVDETLSSAASKIRLIAYASGLVVLHAIYASGSYEQFKITDTDLATGGTLASGKGGIADKGANTTTRTYDNVMISVPATEPVVLYSGRELEVRSDSTERESSAGGTWGRPQSYRGSRFKVNPAGDKDRTTRVAVQASRNDLSTAADDNLTDQLTLSVTVTPRWSVFPKP